jgi:uncharacterized iron-regulated membrane protein
MDNRKYNIYFHTHTISGIIICAVLYVIFFAGSFSFFKDDITAWQKNTSHVTHKNGVTKDFNKVLDSLSEHHKLKGRDFDFSVTRSGMGAYVTMSPSNDSTLKKKAKPKKAAATAQRRGRGRNDDSAYFTYDFVNQKQADYGSSYDMGEFLYRLHFLAQLNIVPLRVGIPFGYLLAGVVSFLFLFALITGLMLHWDKIVSNFFTFRPFNKWKTVWTDMHTALGVIGFPFQLIFAITGVILIVNSVLLLPYTKVLYKGDTQTLYSEMEYSDNTKYEYTYTPLKASFNLNDFVQNIEKKWGQSDTRIVSIRNYQDSNMHVIVTSKPPGEVRFSGMGKIVYRVRDHKILSEVNPLENSSYVDKVKSVVYHLHFGDFGGRPLRVMFFVLGLIGCIVIISGILIWLVARDKNNVPKHKRIFNFWAANVFVASSLSMMPVTAITFIALLFTDKPDQAYIYHWYFYSWLILSIYFIARKNLALTNRHTLILSIITYGLVPVFDGVMRNNWFWNTFQQGAYDILFIDLLFLSIAIVSAIVLTKLKDKPEEEEKPAKRASKAKVIEETLA